MCSCFLHVATCFGLRLCLFNSLLIVESCQKMRGDRRAPTPASGCLRKTCCAIILKAFLFISVLRDEG